MLPKKIAHFKALNLQIDHECIICTKCNKWLTAEIYLHVNGKNYCQVCSTPEDIDRRRNKTLEKIAKSLLFPCEFMNCEYILKTYQVDEHELNCVHAPNNDCVLCDKKGFSLSAFENHLLTDHLTNVCMLDKPLLSFRLAPLPVDFSAKIIYIATYLQHYFLIDINHSSTKLTINIAKIKNIYDQHVSNNFTVYCKTDNLQQVLEKTFVDYSEICTNYEPKSKDFHVDNNAEVNMDLEIFFCDYDKVHNFPECVICNQILGENIVQCLNGHNVCHQCGSMVRNCALCRVRKMNTVKLQFLYPNALKMCQNALNGCLAVGEIDVIRQHERDCFYRTVLCQQCFTHCVRSNIITHHQNAHNTSLIDNMEFIYSEIDLARLNSNNYYVYYKNELFLFKISACGGDHPDRLSFSVKLLYHETCMKADKYKFEIQIATNADKVVHRLQGCCQNMFDNSALMSINYDVYARLMEYDTDFNGFALLSRLVIMEVNPVI